MSDFELLAEEVMRVNSSCPNGHVFAVIAPNKFHSDIKAAFSQYEPIMFYVLSPELKSMRARLFDAVYIFRAEETSMTPQEEALIEVFKSRTLYSFLPVDQRMKLFNKSLKEWPEVVVKTDKSFTSVPCVETEYDESTSWRDVIKSSSTLDEIGKMPDMHESVDEYRRVIRQIQHIERTIRHAPVVKSPKML
ncbi:hypothetical protein AB833_19460 [Chromatiales bacterium (ex Bugula neritina AB1)]|nr:hypothetical protein AB833_19460 [Chromatiales bacterium (ex Bugula neritina AB1)]